MREGSCTPEGLASLPAAKAPEALIVPAPGKIQKNRDSYGFPWSQALPPGSKPSRPRSSIGRATAYQYDINWRPVRAILPELNEAGVGYDTYGNIIAGTTTPKPGQGGPVAASASYPVDTCFSAGLPVLCYRPSWTRDGLGRQTDYAWNSLGQLTEQTDPADPFGVRGKTFVTYDATGGLSRRSVVRRCGHGADCGTYQEIRTETLYWGNTFLLSRERRIDAYYGRTLDTTYGYDSSGRLTVTDGPLPGTDDATYNRYDDFGRKSWEIGARSAEGLRIATRFVYRDSDDKPIYSETGPCPTRRAARSRSSAARTSPTIPAAT